MIVDEAGMVATNDLHTLARLADTNQWNVVLVGAGYQSAQPVAAFATTAGDLAGWSPGRAKVLASDFSAKRSSLEPVAMCYLDGMFGQKEPGGVRERALWVIGADGNPVLYSIGAVVDVGVANPSVKRAITSYPADSKQPTGTLTTVPLNNADSVKGLTPPVTGPGS